MSLTGALAVKVANSGYLRDWDFTDSCSPDSAQYLVISESGMTPGQAVDVSFNSGSTLPNYEVSVVQMSDSLVPNNDNPSFPVSRARFRCPRFPVRQ